MLKLTGKKIFIILRSKTLKCLSKPVLRTNHFQGVQYLRSINKVEDLKVLRRSPDLFNYV